MRGIVLAGLIAAVMAALSALVNSTSTLFSTDIYKKFIHKKATDREMVRVGRIASFAALLIAAAISPIVGDLGGIFQFFQIALTYIACPFMATVLMGILWKRVNYAAGALRPGRRSGHPSRSGEWCSAGCSPRAFPSCTSSTSAASAEVIILVGIVIVTLLTAPPDYAKIAPYVWRAQLLRAYDEGVRRPWYQQLKFWCGIVARGLVRRLLVVLVAKELLQ